MKLDPLNAALVYYFDTGTVLSPYIVDRLADEVEVERDFDRTRARIETRLIVTETYGRGMGSYYSDDFDPDALGAKYPHLRVIVEFRMDRKGRRVAKYYFFERKPGAGLPADPFYVEVINGNQIVTYLKNNGPPRT